MKKLKIKLKDASYVFKDLERQFFTECPNPFRNLIRREQMYWDDWSNEDIVAIIEEYLVDEKFSPEDILGVGESIRERDDKPPNENESSSWLASYRRMRSPGVITFYARNLTGFYWYVIKELMNQNHKFDKELLEDVADRVIKKSYYHELFHHYTDFTRIYTDDRSKYDFVDEEALAVAFSRIYLGHERTASSLSTDFFEIAYNYTGRGYKDWVLYQNDVDFIIKVMNYSAYQLSKLGHMRAENVFNITKSNLETIVENPNVELKIG